MKGIALNLIRWLHFQWHSLTDSHEQISVAEEQVKAQTLAAFSLVLALLYICLLPYVFFRPGYHVWTAVLFLSLVITLVGYKLSRTLAYRWGIGLILTLLFAWALVLAYLRPAAAGVIMLPILLTGILLSWPATLLAAICGIGCVNVLVRSVSSFNLTYFNAVLIALALLSLLQTIINGRAWQRVRRTTRSLAEKERQYRLLVSQLPNSAVFLFDQDMRCILAAGSSLAHIGYDPADLPGKQFQEDFPFADSADYVDLLNSARNNQASTIQVCHGPHTYRIHGQPVDDENGRSIGVVTLAQNITLLRQTEIELRASQQQLDAFFTQSTDGFFFVMLDEPVRWDDATDKEAALDYALNHLQITRVNDAMLAQYRATHQEFLNIALNDIFAPGLADKHALGRQLFDTGQLHLESSVSRLDGNLMQIERDCVCLYDEQQQITGFFGIQRDVTERKQIEQAQMEAEARYRTLFNQSHDAVFILDLNGRHLEANQRAADLLGYSVAELQALSARDLSAEPGQSSQVLERMLQGEHIPLYERLFRRKDGAITPVEINVEMVRDTHGEPLYIQSVLRDISERKRAQLALRESEQRLQGILESLQDIVWVQSIPEKKLLYLSSIVEQISGYPAAAFYADPSLWLIIVHPDDRAFVEESEKQVLIQGKYEWEYRVIRADGDVRWTRSRARLVYDEDGQITQMSGMSSDITIQKEAQAQALALVVEKERVRVLTHFIQTASHELRTPLSIISTYIYLLTKVQDQTKREVYAQRTQEQVIRLNRLVDMLLLMDRLDGNEPFNWQVADLNQLVSLSIQSLESAYQEKQIMVQFEPDDDLPVLITDMEWLPKVIWHLLHNAIRFTPEAGTISITTHCTADSVGFVIQDSGIGLSAEGERRLFERFWREDEAHSTPGFGLGLSIAQKIIERHNGRITINSIRGQGTRVEVNLPLTTPEGVENLSQHTL